VVALSDHNGATAQARTYTPFGLDLGSSGESTNSLAYTGREQDSEGGLYYYRARYYDPEVGRFISEDPLGFEAGINFYAYVGNNPVNFNDPTGNIENFPELIRQGVGVVGSGLGVVGGVVTSGVGVLLVAAPEPTMLSVAGGIALMGIGATGFSTSLDALDGNINSFMNNLLETNIPSSMDLRTDVLNTFGFEANDPVAGGVYDAVSLVSGIPIGRVAGNLLDIPLGASLVGNANTILVAGESIFDSSSSIVNSLDLNSSASGGFVIYPNKSNTNMMQQVYNK